jgi:succinyl-CoA synthetase alpha subunit
MTILVNEQTRILVQGITGREAATFTRESITYGANIVAGVTPGKGGTDVHDVPVFDTVGQALQQHPCDTSVISVPAVFVLDASREAMAHGLRLIVILSERIPRRDVVALLEYAEGSGARVVGPNSLGVIAPGITRIGMAGGSAEAVRRAYLPGRVAIVSRSGGMMTEIANLLTQSGIGQSTCVSIGGDPIIGSTIIDLLPLYEADRDTDAIVMFCEPGGTMEERLAERLIAQPSRLPIIAFVAGRFADQRQGVRFGHAGAIVEGSKGSPAAKIKALRAAGVLVADKLYQIPDLVRNSIIRQSAR